MLQHFGLGQQPFGVTPDPRFLYMGNAHREAVATLRYGIETNRGFLALIAQPGMGKTTTLFHLLDQMRSSARTAFVFNTQCSARDLVRAVIQDAGIDTVGLDNVQLFDQFNSLLAHEAQAGKQVLVVIDEAQNLDAESLEAIRLLSNFETTRAKLLQIILAGQPQLAERLADPSLAQLRQRVSLICRIEPFTAQEVLRYIEHRVRVAGRSDALFSENAVALIAEHSQGIPRKINNLCFHALSLAFALNRRAIDSGMVAEAVNDLALGEQQIPVPAQDDSVQKVERIVAPSGVQTPKIVALAAVEVPTVAPTTSTAPKRCEATKVTAPVVGAQAARPNTLPSNPASARVEAPKVAVQAAVRAPQQVANVQQRREAQPVKTYLLDAEPTNRQIFLATAVAAMLVIGAVTTPHFRWLSAEAATPSASADTTTSGASAIAKIKDVPLERNNRSEGARYSRATVVQSQPPVYPQSAITDHLEGLVVVRASIGLDGLVENVLPVSGPEELSASAIEAVRHWQFKPALRNGKTVPTEQEVQFDFRIDSATRRDNDE